MTERLFVVRGAGLSVGRRVGRVEGVRDGDADTRRWRSVKPITSVGELACRNRNDARALSGRCLENEVCAVGVGLADGLGNHIAKRSVAVRAAAMAVYLAVLLCAGMLALVLAADIEEDDNCYDEENDAAADYTSHNGGCSRAGVVRLGLFILVRV
jgi:hypothetical protein